MLIELRVQNYALIKNLEFTPGKSFNVITGETGAGKSILLGALGLILGERSDSVSTKDNESKCVVEAVFNIKSYGLKPWFDSNDFDYSDELIVRREISSLGKSRGFINDIPAQLNQMKALGKNLIDIHSQHDNLDLFQKAFQFQVLDSYAGILDKRNDFLQQFLKLKAMRKNLIELQEKEVSSINEREFMQFQMDELLAANPQEGELELLEEEQMELSHAENTLQKLAGVLNILSNTETALLDQMALVKNEISQIYKQDKRFADISQRIDETYINLKDVVQEMDQLSGSVKVDPERLNSINERMGLLYDLSRKHKEVDLLKKIKFLDEELSKHEDLGESIKKCQAEIKELESTCLKLANQISEKRIEQSRLLEKEINENISYLGMPGAEIKIELIQNENGELGNNGLDDTNFLYSPAKNKGFNPIQNIASGGEISRVMLVLKTLLAERNVLPTLIFDEIDTGVSGEVALKMGEILKKISDSRQLFVITHLPQIASKGKNHYYVYKKQIESKTVTDIKELEQNERVQEIAEMIGGKGFDDSILKSAQHLLNYKKAELKK